MVDAKAMETGVCAAELALHGTLRFAGVMLDFVAEAGNYVGVPVLAVPTHEHFGKVWVNV